MPPIETEPSPKRHPNEIWAMTSSKIPVSKNYLLHETFLILTFSYLVFFGSSKASLVQPVPLIINAGLVTCIAIHFILQKSKHPSRIDLALGVMMAVMLLASLTSIDPRRSLSEFGLVGFAVCLFLLVCDLIRRGWEAELVVKTLLLIGAIMMAMGWFEAGMWYSQWLAAHPGEWIPSVSYRLPNPNFLAVFFNMWLMGALARLSVCRSRVPIILLCAGILSAFGLIFLTSSRGGWLGTAAGLACLGVIVMLTRRKIWQPFWRRFREKRMLQAAGGLVILTGAAVGGFLLYRQMQAPSHGSRSEFWTPALRAFAESPLLGKGPFTFISAYLRYNSVPPRVTFDYAHSIYMDLLSGTGLLGFVAFGFLMVVATRSLIHALKDTDQDRWAVTAGAIAALAAFCVHGFVDSVHHTAPISLWYLCILCAAALGGKSVGMVSGGWLRLWRAGIALTVMVLSWLNVWMFVPYHQGVLAAQNGDWSQAAQKFSEAARRDANLALAYQQQGLAESMLAAGGQAAALENAIKALRQATEMDPDWAVNHANLGALFRANGNLKDAEHELKRAVELAPGSALYQLNLGIVEEAQDAPAAAAAYQKVLDLRPLWAESSFWIENPIRQRVFETWRARQLPILQMDAAALQMELTSGLLKPYLDLATIYLEGGHLDDAERVLRQAALVYSLDSDERFELSWLNVELAAARGYKEVACKQGDETLNAYVNFGVYGPGSPGNPAYAEYMFRRTAVGWDYVPQMTVILLPGIWEEHAQKLAGWFEEAGNWERAEYWRNIIAGGMGE